MWELGYYHIDWSVLWDRYGRLALYKSCPPPRPRFEPGNSTNSSRSNSFDIAHGSLCCVIRALMNSDISITAQEGSSDASD
jgi:hypothetical protein